MIPIDEDEIDTEPADLDWPEIDTVPSALQEIDCVWEESRFV